MVGEVQRGDIWWADLPETRRPEADFVGLSLLSKRIHLIAAGFRRINVSQVLTLDREFLTDHVRTVSPAFQRLVDAGLRLVLQL